MSLDHIRIVLVNTSHPGNIGAVARAMKNMGLRDLYLVSPEQFPHEDATARSTHAAEILANARVLTSLESAIADCTIIYGTSARGRTLPWPVVTPREMAAEVMLHPKEKIAIIFGPENSGLKNEELALCQKHVWIPTSQEFSSLNLSQAVQIIAYELFQAELVVTDQQVVPKEFATSEQVNGFLNQLFFEMVSTGFMNPQRNGMLKKRIQRLFLRAQLEVEEVNILRGFLSSIERKS